MNEKLKIQQLLKTLDLNAALLLCLSVNISVQKGKLTTLKFYVWIVWDAPVMQTRYKIIEFCKTGDVKFWVFCFVSAFAGVEEQHISSLTHWPGFTCWWPQRHGNGAVVKIVVLKSGTVSSMSNRSSQQLHIRLMFYFSQQSFKSVVWTLESVPLLYDPPASSYNDPDKQTTCFHHLTAHLTPHSAERLTASHLQHFESEWVILALDA